MCGHVEVPESEYPIVDVDPSYPDRQFNCKRVLAPLTRLVALSDLWVALNIRLSSVAFMRIDGKTRVDRSYQADGPRKLLRLLTWIGTTLGAFYAVYFERSIRGYGGLGGRKCCHVQAGSIRFEL